MATGSDSSQVWTLLSNKYTFALLPSCPVTCYHDLNITIGSRTMERSEALEKIAWHQVKQLSREEGD